MGIATNFGWIKNQYRVTMFSLCLALTSAGNFSEVLLTELTRLVCTRYWLGSMGGGVAMYKPLIPIADITMYIICETSLISISIDTKTRQFISYNLFPVSTIDGFNNINVRSHERRKNRVKPLPKFAE